MSFLFRTRKFLTKILFFQIINFKPGKITVKNVKSNYTVRIYFYLCSVEWKLNNKTSQTKT